ncbi:MAG: hypothetical protein POELPBGB_01562 [Bacteroidia bacterium]|nr:hypothetical protein [Bacteroidia bacterium]
MPYVIASKAKQSLFMRKMLMVILFVMLNLFQHQVLAQTLNNDLLLNKPLINTNEPDGGYYSEYFYQSFQQLFCGAIVQNTGTQGATNVYLQLDLLDNNNAVISTYYSDTILVLDTNQVDTVNIPQAITDFNYNYYYRNISYRIISDSIDENQSNNEDIIPFTALYQSDWNHTSRAAVATNTLNISQIENFQSGDFIGVSLNLGSWHHLVYGLQVSITEPWSDSLLMMGKIYQNGVVIDSVPFYNGGSSYFYSFGGSLIQDSTFYVGVEITCPPGTPIPMGVDTSCFHNFESETIARIGNTWITLNFVPLISLVCDPEGIEEINGTLINIYPNPATTSITITGYTPAYLTLCNTLGQTVAKASNTNTIWLGALPQGLYLLQVFDAKGALVKTEKVVKE